jgi:DNA-binding protein YbaB
MQPTGDNGGIAGFARDPEAVERRIQAWAQGFEAKAERYQAAQAKTEQLRLTAASADGAVRVTVLADGTVTDIQFSERIRTMPLADLSAQIMATMKRAQGDIAGRVGEVMAEQLGDEDLQTREFTLANLRSRFPEMPDEAPGPDADEWDFPDETDAEPPAAPPAPPPPPSSPPPPPPPAPPTARPQRPRPRPGDDDDDDFDPLQG